MTGRRVALLRGINVGRAKRIAMADLRALCEGLGYTDVRTVLNSGNVVFTLGGRSRKDPAVRIHEAIAKELGVSTRVTVLTGEEVLGVVNRNPLANIADNPSRLLVMVPSDERALAGLHPLFERTWGDEALASGSRVVYLWCPAGVLESRLLAEVNRVLGDEGTARNMATMEKLAALAGDEPARR